MIGKIPCSLTSGRAWMAPLTARSEDGKGELKVNVGDTVEAFCMGWSDEGIKLTVKISGDMVDSSIEQALRVTFPWKAR